MRAVAAPGSDPGPPCSAALRWPVLAGKTRRSGRAASSYLWGFTLVELVVALVILEVGLLGVAGILLTAAHQLGLATELTQVTSARGKEMPDGALRLESLNPVFIVSARRGI